jgi:hypothetical protein
MRHTKDRVKHLEALAFVGGVAIIAPHVVTDLAAPDCHQGSFIADGAFPGQDIAVGGLHD